MNALFSAVLVLVLANGCGKKDEPAGPAAAPTSAPHKLGAPATTAQAVAPTPAAPLGALSPADEAAEIFSQRCVTCHGPNGLGDGPASTALNPKPRNYTDSAWQEKVTDEELKKAIVGGGPSVGLSPLMPPNPDLANKPAVVDELVKKIRSFKKG